MLRWRAAALRVLRAHALFGSVLLVAVIVRVIAMLGYPPAFWITDSRRYVAIATHLIPDPIRPVGYSVMLWLLKPFHSVMLVVGIQHAMGLAAGMAVYALLRQRFGLPAWAATLAAAPPLLSVYTIQIEHFLLADTLFGLLVTIAVVLMLWTPLPRVLTCAVVGLLLAAAALVRSQGLLVAIPFAIYLATRMASRRTRPSGMSRRLVARRAVVGLLAMGATFAAPMLAYALWFDSVNGTFEITTSTGAYLYGRVSTFADCSVINPPADEQWLCLSAPVSQRANPGHYVWQASSPLVKGPGYHIWQPNTPLLNSSTYEFSPTVNHLATDFALRAIKAQPLDYLRAVWDSTVEGFTVERGPTGAWYGFPRVLRQSTESLADPVPYLRAGLDAYEHGDPNTRLVQPFADWIRIYQRFVKLLGPLLAAIVLGGLIGVAVAWRRLGGAALLPWLAGMTLIVTPAATAGFDTRYVVASVPAFCIAAAIGARGWAPAATPPEGRGSERRGRRLRPGRRERPTDGELPEAVMQGQRAANVE
jgi:hypothetical protein